MLSDLGQSQKDQHRVTPLWEAPGGVCSQTQTVGGEGQGLRTGRDLRGTEGQCGKTERTGDEGEAAAQCEYA